MTADRPRIVLWSHLPPAGGGLTVVARRLAADPSLNEWFRMEFRGTHEASPDLVGRFTPHNIWRAFRDAAALFRVARGAAVTQIFSSGHTTTVLFRGVLLSVAARLGGSKVLIFLGSGRLYPPDPAEFVPTRGMPQLYRLLGLLVDAFVIIDDNARAVLAPMVGRARLVLLPPPVDEDRFTSAPRPGTDRPVMVHAGRITREKGVIDLLRACSLLDEGGLDSWELRLVGPLERSTGGELEQIEELARELGRVTFVGWLDDISAELANADLFVSASHREGLSGAIVEACMSGLPVVATRVGAVATVVRDGENGSLVDVHRPDLLADAIEELLRDRGGRERMGNKGRELAVELYGRKRIADRYRVLYEGLIGGRNR